ncbi:MAG: hypothetical protein ACOY90_16185 [Candidatus Zhuqueibacterota bacterium]
MKKLDSGTGENIKKIFYKSNKFFLENETQGEIEGAAQAREKRSALKERCCGTQGKRRSVAVRPFPSHSEIGSAMSPRYSQWRRLMQHRKFYLDIQEYFNYFTIEQIAT